MIRKLLFGTVSLVAVNCLVLGAPSAFATCSAAGLPSGQDFEIGSNGLLDGNIITGSAYPECEVATSHYVIPFFVPTAEEVEISLTEDGYTGAFYDLTVDPGTANVLTNNQAGISSTATLGSDLWKGVAVPAGVNTLDIFENNDSSAFEAAPGDGVEVAMQFYSFIPEPATLGLLGFGAACLVALRRRQRLA
jgi:PEP-CTERM motif